MGNILNPYRRLTGPYWTPCEGIDSPSQKSQTPHRWFQTEELQVPCPILVAIAMAIAMIIAMTIAIAIAVAVAIGGK